MRRWQPLLTHRSALPVGAAEAGERRAPTRLLLLPSRVGLCPVKADVTQQALLLPSVVRQLR